MIFNSRGKLEATSILIHPRLHVPPSLPKFKKTEENDKTITKPNLLMGLNKLLALQ